MNTGGNSGEDHDKQVDEFSKVIGLACNAFAGELFYHEMIGILHVHLHRLSAEAYEAFEDE